MPTELMKMHGSQGMSHEDKCWRHLMSWKRTSFGSAEVSLTYTMCPAYSSMCSRPFQSLPQVKTQMPQQ